MASVPSSDAPPPGSGNEPHPPTSADNSEQYEGSSVQDNKDLPLYAQMWIRGDQAHAQYNAGGDLEALEVAVRSYRIAMDATEDDNAEKISVIANFGMALHARFKRVGGLHDLEESINLNRIAEALTSDDSPYKPLRLCNLCTSLFSLFKQHGRAEDLEEAIKLGTRADELVPDNRVEKPALLNSLGNLLSERYKHSGSIDDLKSAIELQTHAVELTSSNQSDDPAWLTNLGISLQWRFDQLGNLEDLEKAITLQLQSVELTPASHPDKPSRLTNAGSALQTRFLRLGNLEDIDSAVTLQSYAVELTPESHPDKPTLLNNLANSLEIRYDRTGVLNDLETSIAHQTRAAELTADSHTDKPLWLGNLGLKLHTRFEKTGCPDDLNQAITHQTSAVKLTPESHSDKPSWLHNLGSSLLLRFEQVGNAVDLEEAIRCAAHSVELLPENRPHRVQTFRLLGALYVARLRSPHAHADDATHAMDAYLEAMAAISQGHPLERLRACCLCANLLTEFSHLFTVSPKLTLLQAYEYAINLIPQCIWLGNNVRGRYTSTELGVVREVVNDAAAAAIAAGEYGLALEWLETGRSVIWSQILQLRTPLDGLQRLHPQLAHDLCRISEALQHAATSSTLPGSADTQHTQISLNSQSESSHIYALEYNKLITHIRNLEGFGNFMRPKTLSQLARACASGPVVVINVHESRCDALILCRAGDVVHVPLPDLSLSLAMFMQSFLWDLLRAKRLLNRCRGDVQDGEKDRGGRTAPMDPPDLMRVILAQLWDRVVKPVMDVVYTLVPPSQSQNTLPHVTWCPTGPLAFLPLHAAGIYPKDESPRTQSQTLMDIAVSSYTPTLEALLKPRTQLAQSTPSPRVLVVSQPETPDCQPIPETATEAGIVMSLVDANPLHDADGTVDAVLKGMVTHEWIHLACHGVQSHTDPINSAFILYDGKLTLSTLMSQHIPNADLAVLSACQTATGDEKLSEEAVHLAAGMLNVGYKSVVGTMWSISDRIAPMVMETFYRVMAEQVKAGGELQPAYALHEATKALRNKKDGLTDFLRWVPFVHFGL